MGHLSLIFFVLFLRFILIKLNRGKSYLFLCYIGATAPLVVLILELVDTDALTVIIAGFSLFYFALLAGKKEKENGLN